MTTRAYIAFGSNLGNRERNIREALRRLQMQDGVFLTRVSPVYECEAEGFREPAPPFLNGVVELEVNCSAKDLLAILLGIEKELGRIRSENTAYQSRPIDLDLLLMGDAIIQEPNLTVPHPRMAQRGFVLRPLADLNSGELIPGENRSIQEALDRLGPLETIRPTEICVWNQP